MKLSTLVSFRNNLQSLIPVDSAPFVHKQLATLVHTVKAAEFQNPALTEQLESDYNKIVDNITEFEETVLKITEAIDGTIAHFETSYYNDSKILYAEMMDHDSVGHILNRRFTLSEAAEEFISARIQLHGLWQHAGMIIRPGHEDWIDMLVGCDPLYLVDTSLALVEPAVLRFNDQYKRRLRTYVSHEELGANVLRELPDSQFAYCLAYNFFNFKPEHVIFLYLDDVFKKLKPGGEFAFTFNDGDRAGAVRLAEQNYSFYTPGNKIYAHAKKLGFVVHQTYDINQACTWVELHKPGTLESLRGGQSLAEVVPKT